MRHHFILISDVYSSKIRRTSIEARWVDLNLCLKFWFDFPVGLCFIWIKKQEIEAMKRKKNQCLCVICEGFRNA
ncbi:unnamed protein product [Lactuca virosa]|uniref:Uncharacterized protein n=1 Tax=Lactuca virosa TaxID=75947 RepID=A0AAU9MRJ2_9ASTR|nr:unnamed protein product [Lactuca virosa]